MDPGQDLRNARAELARTPTVQNRVRLGMTLLDAGQAEEARTLLEQAASSPLGDDPYILTGLARARLDSGSPRVRRRRWTACSPAIRMCAASRNRPCFTRRHWRLPKRPASAPRSSEPWNAETMPPPAACTPSG